MSFHEKSAWACLVTIVAVFVPYFVSVLQYPVTYIPLFIGAVALLIGLLIVFHLINALVSPEVLRRGDGPPRDERDQSIEQAAARTSGFVLGFVVLVWCLNAMVGIPVAAISNVAELAPRDQEQALAGFAVPAVDALRAIHMLFGGFVVSNVIYYAMIIVGYRRAGG